MAIITVKLISATLTGNKANLTVSLKDESNHIWEKTYTYETTGIIAVQAFKDRISADIKKDLQLKDQLKDLQALVGKTFTLTI